ncbi:MAG: DEAD/DEAH box helicase family protein [Candidatus Kuenenia sp.]|nr:DEAD/DEAH box helicase family protein [Candidatus Kuenenia hertensis]
MKIIKRIKKEKSAVFYVRFSLYLSVTSFIFQLMNITKWFARNFITQDIISSIKDAIHNAGGNEVFFIGRPDKNHMIADVEVYAMGNKRAVPAVLEEVKFGEVVIHNHPNGNLEPSDADVELASVMGSIGVGFYIINNEAEYVYPVVKIAKEHTYEKLDCSVLSQFFQTGGILSDSIPGYEYRESQVEMLTSVSNAFNNDKIATIEAGTGTGKSLAYLLPAIFWSIKNKERIVVSTNTINLQEQLIYKDIPMLRIENVPGFKSVLVKGRNNYVCLRKAQNLKIEGNSFVGEKEKNQLANILSWVEQTKDGSKSDLGFIPDDDIWEMIQSEVDQCMRLKCNFYDQCFFYTARRNAASADILVINHYLLMADLILRREVKGFDSTAILPPFKRIIIDEAHNLESVATTNLGLSFSRMRILKPLGKLVNQKDNKKGLLNFLKNKLKDISSLYNKDIIAEIHEKIYPPLFDARLEIFEKVNNTFFDISESVYNYVSNKNIETGDELKLRVTDNLLSAPLWNDIIEKKLKTLCTDIHNFVILLNKLIDTLERFNKESQDALSSLLIDIISCKKRLKVAANDMYTFILSEVNLCRWIELKKYNGNFSIKFCTAPISISKDLKECLYGNYQTIILTSATLTTGNTFTFYKKNTGLDLLPKKRLTELILKSPFDYKKQSVICIPTDISDPDGIHYKTDLVENLRKLITITDGRSLVLFTSYRLLNDIYNILEPYFTNQHYTCLKQGTDNRHSLLETFKNDKTSILFATDSFWEGIDVKGDALECVIITRLPFKVPNEPIIEARTEAIEMAGGNSFYDYSLPTAVLKLKQGFGRLIRSKEDRGVVFIFDKRIATKRYGNFFLQSLPEAKCIKGSKDIIFHELEAFFKR